MPTRGIARSTDRDYIYHRFVRLAEKHPLSFVPNESLLFLARATRDYLGLRVRASLRWPIHDELVVPIRVPADADVVFSYGLFPRDRRSAVPVVWEQTFAPASLDVREDELAAGLRRDRSWAVSRAHTIVTATEASVDWVRRVFPEARDRVQWVPYYLPALEPAGEAQTAAKFSSGGPLRILFVGKQARRKGLDVLVAAHAMLPSHLQEKLAVTVVSRMLDGRVALPPSFRWHEALVDVDAAMRDAHVLAFPTKHEAFGLVLVEAMASGCAIVTTKAPIQRSIVGDGGARFVDPRRPEELRDALAALVSERGLAQTMAAANLARFRAFWHHDVVGPQYASALGAAPGRV